MCGLRSEETQIDIARTFSHDEREATTAIVGCRFTAGQEKKSYVNKRLVKDLLLFWMKPERLLWNDREKTIKEKDIFSGGLKNAWLTFSEAFYFCLKLF